MLAEAYSKDLWQAQARVGHFRPGPDLPHHHAKAEDIHFLVDTVLLKLLQQSKLQ